MAAGNPRTPEVLDGDAAASPREQNALDVFGFRARQPKYDKHALKAKYAACDLNFAEFCREENVPLGTIRRYFESENWSQARDDFRKKQSLLVQQRAIDRAVEVETKIDEKAHNAAVRLTTVASQILETVADADEESRANGGPPLLTLSDAPKLKMLVDTLKEAHRLARVTAHLTPEPIPSGLQLNFNRLSHERQKLLKELLEEASG